MYTKLDEQRRKQILGGFVQKGCNASDIFNSAEEKQSASEETSPAKQEREKELKKD